MQRFLNLGLGNCSRFKVSLGQLKDLVLAIAIFTHQLSILEVRPGAPAQLYQFCKSELLMRAVDASIIRGVHKNSRVEL
jgi:hypothetical protein